MAFLMSGTGSSKELTRFFVLRFSKNEDNILVFIKSIFVYLSHNPRKQERFGKYCVYLGLDRLYIVHA